MYYEDEERRRARALRQQKTKKAREQFLMLILLMTLIPTILCIVLLVQQVKLQKEVTRLEQLISEEGALSGKQQPSEGLSGGPTDSLAMHEGEENRIPTQGTGLTPEPTPTLTPIPTPSPTPTIAPTPTTEPVATEEKPWADKKIYLTFDDGPSSNTDELLDLLASYGVKATFFVIGRDDTEGRRLYQRIVEEGHTIGMHSYSHEYDKIYKSVEDFEKDFTKISNVLYDTIGYVPNLYRFPGGSSNQKCKALTIQPFIRFLTEHNMRYFDWNVENGDATGVSYTPEELAQNVLDGVKSKKTSVVLCHDTKAKTKTLESMKILIPQLLEKGAQILPITDDTDMVRHVKPADE